jgi:adenosylcobinamide-GDP ribazoletransferase
VIRALRAIAGAFSYFSILPLGGFSGHEPPDAVTLSFLPLVGLVIGGLAGGIGYAASVVHVPYAFAIAWIASLVLTGALHVDGFLDSCDALIATASPERRLEILKDPRHGTYAVVGMAVLTVAMLVALAPIPPARLPLAFAFAAGAARVAAVCNAWIFPYARAGASALVFEARPNIAVVAVSALVVEALAWFIAPPMLAVLPVAIVLSLAGGRWAARRLGGGLVGDVYGATVCALEVVALLCVAGA